MPSYNHIENSRCRYFFWKI